MRPLILALIAATTLAACGGGGSRVDSADARRDTTAAENSQGGQQPGVAAAAFQNYLMRLSEEDRERLTIPLNIDSQRLVNSARDTYGPRAIVRAHPPSAALGAISDFENGVLVATMEVISEANWPLVDTYGALYIDGPGLYCVRLKSARQGTGPNYDWERAYVDKAPSTGCDPAGPVNTAQPLDVVEPRPPFSTDASHYLGVARWTEARMGNPDNRRAGIVVKCASNECELLPVGARPLPPGHSTELPPGKRSRIKVWHDEQTLAVVHPGATKPTPSKEDVASAVPLPAVEDISDEADYSTEREVIEVVFPKVPAVNSKYWNLGFRQKVNVVVLKKGNPDPMFWGRAWIKTNPGNPFDVRRHSHSVPPAPTARWQWRDSDEALWVRCGSGCCDVDMTL